MEQMAGQLSGQLQSIASSVIMQEALQTISVFSGTENVTNWISELEKVKVIHNLLDSAINQLAWARSKGSASIHIGRILKEQPELTWENLQSDLERVYGTVVDPQQAFAIIKNLKQRREENIMAFSERLLQMAGKVYGSTWRNAANHLANQQLSSIFLDGLLSTDLKTKLFMKGLASFVEIVEEAKKEDVTKKGFG